MPSKDSSEEITESTAVLVGAADLALRNIPYSDYRFQHTKIFVERKRNRMKKESKKIREEEPKYSEIVEVWTKQREFLLGSSNQFQLQGMNLKHFNYIIIKIFSLFHICFVISACITWTFCFTRYFLTQILRNLSFYSN